MSETIQVGKAVFLKLGSMGDFICDVHDSILIGPGKKADNVLIAHEAYEPGKSKILAIEEWPANVIWTQGDVIYSYEALVPRLIKGVEDGDLTQEQYDLATSVAVRAYAEKWSYTVGRTNTSRLSRLLHG